jgi:hypothetical protein
MFLLLFGFTIIGQKVSASVITNDIITDGTYKKWEYRTDQSFNTQKVWKMSNSEWGTYTQEICSIGLPYTSTPNNLIVNTANLSQGSIWVNCITPVVGDVYSIFTTGASGTTTANYDITHFQIGSGTVSSITGYYTDTQITDINSPIENTVVNAGTPPFTGNETADIEFDIDIWFNSVNDSSIINKVCVMIENMEVPNPQTYIPQCSNIIASGGSNHTFTFEDMPKGRYFAIGFFTNNAFDKVYPTAWEFINIYTSVQNQSCLYGNAYLGTCPDPDLGLYATSTTPWVIEGLQTEDCSLYNGTTEIAEKVGCALTNVFKNTVNVLFVPNGEQIQDLMINARENIATRFPIGYIYSFIEIISSNATSTLTVLNAKIPNGIPGTGSEITLNLNGVLDPYLNATTSGFSNETASSTETLGEFTLRYWEYIIYILALLYVIRRIIGSHVIPNKHI